MAAPPPTPHLSSLGVMLGPGLLDQLREMASQGDIDYYKLSIAFILELGSALVYRGEYLASMRHFHALRS